MDSINGFISVSTENSKLLIDNNITKIEKIRLFPNGIDQEKFKKIDKKIARKELNFNTDEKIGIYVGSFTERKGIKRVDKASESIENLKMIYIGSGNQYAESKNVLFQGSVAHNLIYKYLSAADFFILPTQAEGCCNAILEAMSCGLPIISSTGEFNDDILSDEYSIRVDPNNIEEIKQAIKNIIKDDSKLSKMSTAALRASKKFDINERAKNILKYITQ